VILDMLIFLCLILPILKAGNYCTSSWSSYVYSEWNNMPSSVIPVCSKHCWSPAMCVLINVTRQEKSHTEMPWS
jgi:hypothetical protein